jgi:YD repeat-containing protein
LAKHQSAVRITYGVIGLTHCHGIRRRRTQDGRGLLVSCMCFRDELFLARPFTFGIGQPTQYSHPNGMTTVYTYDANSMLTTIEHKDGETVKKSFTYALDDVGNISTMTQDDGTVWDYDYDGRYRLITATRDNAAESPTISATYTYPYDDRDTLYSVASNFPSEGNVTYDYGGDQKRRERTAGATPCVNAFLST